MDEALEDTICAVATPAGEGGIGIVRISGPGALAVAEQIVRLRANHPLGQASPHTLHLVDIVGVPPSFRGDRIPAPVRDDLIDEGYAVYMKAPRSFTGEDVVEIHCHGSGVVLGRVCQACLAVGARLAQPGEFTKRAFLNGRLDLSQAEAVLDTIRAKSETGLRVAQRHLRGELGQQVERLRGGLLRMLAQVEAGIDFVDEDITFIGRDELTASLQKTLEEVHEMLITSERGRVLREGARVVIVGRPNAGKSSLLNRLLREDRAIVTSVPGTTRDVIEESVVWNGFRVTLVDTAGLRDTTDVVELEGIKRTRAAQDLGDMVLHVVDATECETQGEEGPASLPAGRRDVLLLNKCDVVDPALIKERIGQIEQLARCTVLPISAKTGMGVEDVTRCISAFLSRWSFESDEGVVVTNVRHRRALERATASLREALVATRKGMEAECIAVDLRGASDSLGEITGAITSEEILNQIFSEFCIGK